MTNVFFGNGYRLADAHSGFYSVSKESESESVYFRPFRYCFSLAEIFKIAVVFFISSLLFAGRPANIPRPVPVVVVDPVNAEFVDRLRAWAEIFSNVIAERKILFPFVAHCYPSIVVTVGLFEFWLASLVHVRPPEVKICPLLRVFIFPVLSETRSRALYFPAPAALNDFQVMPFILLGLSALAKAVPYRISFGVKSIQANYGQAMEFVSSVVFDVSRNVHLFINCGSPQIVNSYA